MVKVHGRAGQSWIMTFISEIALAKLENVDETLEEELPELGVLIAKQFRNDFKKEVEESMMDGTMVGDPVLALTDSVCLKLVKGRDEEEFSRLSSEIGRLRVCFYDAELQKLAAIADEEGASTALASVKKHLAKVEQGVGSTGYIAKPLLVVNLKQKVVEFVVKLSSCSSCHCNHILTADYQLKTRRNEYVLERQGRIVEVLLGQRVRQDMKWWQAFWTWRRGSLEPGGEVHQVGQAW